jgi:fluoride exporter
LNQAFLIFVGGGLGSLARYYIGKSFLSISFNNLPIGTLMVNIAASFILGVFIGFESSSKLEPNYRALIAIGFCGGFSTFSTFSAETLQLINSLRYTEALLNIFLNVFICILVTFVGIYLTKL